MKFIVRGDCTSRRMLMLNRAKFSTSFSLVTNEKAPNAVFCDHLDGLIADPELVTKFIDESRMGKSQLLYFRRQFERNILSETGASLLVIDPYSEMNFQLWRHKEVGWRFWVPKNSISDMPGFLEAFESEGYLSIERSIQDTARVVKHIQSNNPGMPVLFLPQILDLYPALAEREYFNDLGEKLRELIPELHVGKRIPLSELVPDDLGTGGGPGLTLHYSGETYWKCASPALDNGLLIEIVSRVQAVSKIHSNSLNVDAENKILALQKSSALCISECINIVQAVKTNLQQYFIVEDPEFERTKELKYRSAIIDLEKYRSYSEYEAYVKLSGKGARIRQRNKASRNGFFCKPFHWRMHIPDIQEINTSTEVRSGGVMRSSYTKSVEEMGGAPNRAYTVVKPKCPNHWTHPWGVFQPIPGYIQGNQVTNEKLVGYIFLRRFGEFLLYSQILGHYGHLSSGIMTLLHHEVMKWTLDSYESEVQGVKAVMYAGFDQGTEGLRDWKKREGFEPFLMTVHD